ncbi:hypothetical protein Dthio_PD2968 [Desulfonatronospira thiodismutans ASO3-1]|uniref:Uncharacterized protein n=1 Tax=Desulfonatronospira thiodismutans ASO3-1 TaxID=555779 RepID=D6SLI3_9BACT|nr:hypothetical protein [Desulfonatronospira thiodismutans]EFI35544.1 hypothetical protein Dthio_PD2968 [Desulfonatronospira thiodismutans ASO3-1]
MFNKTLFQWVTIIFLVVALAIPTQVLACGGGGGGGGGGNGGNGISESELRDALSDFPPEEIEEIIRSVNEWNEKYDFGDMQTMQENEARQREFEQMMRDQEQAQRDLRIAEGHYTLINIGNGIRTVGGWVVGGLVTYKTAGAPLWAPVLIGATTGAAGELGNQMAGYETEYINSTLTGAGRGLLTGSLPDGVGDATGIAMDVYDMVPEVENNSLSNTAPVSRGYSVEHFNPIHH